MRHNWNIFRRTIQTAGEKKENSNLWHPTCWLRNSAWVLEVSSEVFKEFLSFVTRISSCLTISSSFLVCTAWLLAWASSSELFKLSSPRWRIFVTTWTKQTRKLDLYCLNYQVLIEVQSACFNIKLNVFMKHLNQNRLLSAKAHVLLKQNNIFVVIVTE